MDWDKFFFSNVGKQIKSIIRGIFYTEAILTIIAGVVAEAVSLYYLFDGDGEFFLIMLGIPVGVVLAIGVLWLSTLLTYGFAEIVDTAIVNREAENIASNANREQEEMYSFSNTTFTEKTDFWQCPHCYNDLYVSESGDFFYCHHCQQVFEIVNKGETNILREI